MENQKDQERLAKLFQEEKLIRPPTNSGDRRNDDIPSSLDLFKVIRNWNEFDIQDSNNASMRNIQNDQVGNIILSAAGVNVVPPVVVFCLIDAMGYNLLMKHLPADSFILRHCVTPLKTVFPSSTFSVLGSYFTGMEPGNSGLLARKMFDSNKGVIDYTTADLPKLNYWMDSITTRKLVKFEPSTMFYRHSNSRNECDYIKTEVGAKGLIESFDKLSEYVCSNIKEPTFVYFYHNYLSPMGNTSYTDGYGDILRDLDKSMEKCYTSIKNQFGNDVIIITTADHGQLDVTHLDKDITEDEDILSIISGHSGSHRFMFFTVPELNRPKFEMIFREKWGKHAVLLNVEQIEEMHLISSGNLSDEAKRAIGDYGAIPITNVAFFNRKKKCSHGSLTEDEMIVPLIVK